ncbi:MAG: multiheme c-type cytochrome [Spirochaetota bacterium]
MTIKKKFQTYMCCFYIFASIFLVLSSCSKAKNNVLWSIFPFENGRFAISYNSSFTSVNHKDGQILSDSGSCQTCHKQVYKNWYNSRHRVSFSNKLYKEAHSREPMQWCLNCHAPLLSQKQERVQAEDGISCIVCHVRDKKVLVPALPEKKQGTYTHTYKVVPEFKQAEFCANCHQFNFPTASSGMHTNPIIFTDVSMQNTFKEWQSSSYYKKSNCQTCHLKPYSQESHTFPGGHHREKVSAAIQLYAERVNDYAVSIQVTSLGIGHNFPTGDLFRTLRIIFRSQDSLVEELILRRTFENIEEDLLTKDSPNKQMVLDTTIPAPNFGDYAAKRTFVITVPASIRELRYEMYMDYLNGVNHMLSTVPLVKTRPLVRKGRLKIHVTGESNKG